MPRSYFSLQTYLPRFQVSCLLCDISFLISIYNLLFVQLFACCLDEIGKGSLLDQTLAGVL